MYYISKGSVELFVYTLDEDMRKELLSQGFKEIKTPLIINDKKAYCFSCEQELKLDFSQKDKTFFSQNLFL